MCVLVVFFVPAVLILLSLFYYEMLPKEKMQRMINIWILSTPILSKPLHFVILKKNPYEKSGWVFILGDKLKNILTHKNAYQAQNFP